MLLGSQHMGWVPASWCRPVTFGGVQSGLEIAWAPTPTLTSSAAANSLSQQDQDQFACICSLKQCLQLQQAAAGGSMQGPGAVDASRGVVQLVTLEVVKQQLLRVEGLLPPGMLGGSSSGWWCQWRAQVVGALTPQQLGAQVRGRTSVYMHPALVEHEVMPL
jgi:hypothetical protein